MKKELIKEIGVYLLFAAIIYFFYRSWWAFILLPPACFIYHRFNKKNISRKTKEILGLQFKDALGSMTAALRAGYSVENSLKESRREMESLYGADSPIYMELNRVVHEISLGINTETALSNMAKRSGVEDISTFASVFQIAKRGGGDLVDIINKTAGDIAAKADTKNEISVLVSSKKLEQNIMTFMPLAMILYIGISAPSMLSPLYGNLPGILIMTICLAVYAAAYYISKKIMDIEV